ncbi:MAG: alpha/beta fold hydrolase [Chloroflexota bacterium]
MSDLFVEKIGSGTPVLVMHGGLGLDHNYFRPSLDGLSDVAEIIYYDHRGNGRSPAFDSYDEMSFEQLIDDADALRQSLGYDKIVLYGHSYGGFIAQNYALKYQDNLAGLILASTSYNIHYEPVFPDWQTEEAMGGIGRIFGGPFETDEEFAQTWRTALPIYWKDMPAGLSAEIDSNTVYKAGAWNRAFAMLGEFDLKGQLSAINVPTLIMSGLYDFITGRQAHEDLHAEIEGSTLVKFDDSAHFPMHSETEAYLAAIKAFLAAL